MWVQVGRFATPFGGYAQRHRTVRDPLVRPPLPYEHRTVMSRTVVPGSTAAFLTWKNRPDEFRGVGAPQVWDVPYQWGGMASGALGPVAFRLALMNGPPSAEPSSWDLSGGLDQPSVVAHASVRPVAGLQIGASWDRGAYFEGDGSEQLVPESTQEIFGLEVVFDRGPLTLRSEAFRGRWQAPGLTNDPRETSLYLEASRKLPGGFHAAVRWGAIWFGEVAAAEGDPERWDHDVHRWSVGGGYRIARNAGIKLELQTTSAAGPGDLRDDLFALQAWWEF